MSLYPHQKEVLRAIGAFDPQPTDKRATVKAARRANVRRMQRERAKGRSAPPEGIYDRFARAMRRSARACRATGASMRQAQRQLKAFRGAYAFGGTITGRRHVDPEVQFIRERIPGDDSPDPVGLALKRTEPFRKAGMVTVVSTPMLDADFSDIEKRVMAQLRDKVGIQMDVLAGLKPEGTEDG